MEEVVANQAGGSRRPAKASRRRTGGNATGPPPPNLPEGGLALALAAEDEEGDPNARHLNKEWSSKMAMSLLLVWVKSQAITHPPTWLPSARLNLYNNHINISLILEVAIVVELCLFKLKVAPAARARIIIVRTCMVVGLVNSLVAAAATMDWSGMAAVVAPSVAIAVLVLYVLWKVNELLLRD